MTSEELAQTIADAAQAAVGVAMSDTIRDALRDGLFTGIAEAILPYLSTGGEVVFGTSGTLTLADPELVVITSNGVDVSLPATATAGRRFTVVNSEEVGTSSSVSGNIHGNNTSDTLTGPHAHANYVWESQTGTWVRV